MDHTASSHHDGGWTRTSASLGAWLREAADLATLVGSAEVVGRLREIEALRRAAGFRLAVVGQLSTGKSALLNRLLDLDDLLPVGDVATTAVVTSIAGGEPTTMEIRRRDGSRESVPCVPESWADLLAPESGGPADGPEAHVRLVVDRPLLRENGIELLDTPGFGGLDERHAALATEALLRCDAALLTVTASRAFTRTEHELLVEQIIGGSAARAAVAVTHLDVPPAGERGAVLESVRRKVAAISPDISVLPTMSLTGGDGSAEIEAIRAEIRRISRAGDRPAQRARQVAEQLVAALDALHAHAEQGEREVRLDDDERTARQAALVVAFKRVRLRLESLTVEFQERERRAEGSLRAELRDAHRQLAAALDDEIAHEDDPRRWWHRQPLRLRREILAICGRLDQRAARILADDTEQLDAQLRSDLANELAGVSHDPAELRALDDVATPGEKLQLTDIHRLRFAWRAGAAAVLVVMTVLGAGPIAVAAGLGAAAAEEWLLIRSVDEQRPALRAAVRTCLERALSAYEPAAFKRLRESYTNVVNACGASLDQLERDRVALACAPSPSLRVDDWAAARERTGALRGTILTALVADAAKR